MRVAKLIEQLSKLDPDLMVYHLWDGAARTRIEIVYVSKGGDVITADYGEVVYGDENRPHDAPTRAEDRYWRTPANPFPEDDN